MLGGCACAANLSNTRTTICAVVLMPNLPNSMHYCILLTCNVCTIEHCHVCKLNELTIAYCQLAMNANFHIANVRCIYCTFPYCQLATYCMHTCTLSTYHVCTIAKLLTLYVCTLPTCHVRTLNSIHCTPCTVCTMNIGNYCTKI